MTVSLEERARKAGLAVDWIDATGHRHTVSSDTLRDVLDSLNGYEVAQDQPDDSHRCFSIDAISQIKQFTGLAAQVYALRSSGQFGDLGAVERLAVDMAAHSIDAIAISPIHAPFLSSLDDPSPYSPSSRLFLNPLYAATDAEDDGQDGLIDWPTAAREKLQLLRSIYPGAPTGPADEKLRDHAVFDALDAHFRKRGIWCWQNWPQAYRQPRSDAVNEFARQHAQDIDFNIFLQQKVREDLSHAQKAARTAGMSIGLIADIAVGMSPHGSHAWSAQSDVLHGLTIGAPPDIFNTEGQNWGLTALSPSAGDRAFADTWSAGMKHAGGIRIDHILGLQRLWVIPEGASAAEGVYLRYPMHRLIRILAEESQRYHAIVIGEDLGTVPEGFRETIRAANILGMEVLWFQCDGGGYFAPEHWSRKAVALSTTHDLPTIAGWWSGRDIDWLEKLDRKSENGDANAERDARVHARWKLWNMIGQGAPPATDDYRSVVTAALEFVGRTADEIAIVPVEDVLALTEQPNIPGTTSQHPNWRRRLPAGSSFQHLEAHTNIAALLRGRSQR